MPHAAAPTILFYIDSGAMLAHCLAVARTLRGRLGARIVLVVVDSERHKAALAGFEVLDYALLFREPGFIGETVRRLGQPAESLAAEEAGRMSPPGRSARMVAAAIEAMRQLSRPVASDSAHPEQRAGSVTTTGTTQYARARRFRPPRRFRRRLRALRGPVRASVRFGWSLAALWTRVVAGTRALGASLSWQARRILRAGARAALTSGRISIRMVSRACRAAVRAVFDARRATAATRTGTAVRSLSTRITVPLGRLKAWRRGCNGIHALVSSLAPDAIVLAEDNIETYSRAFVVHGAAVGAPTLIVPFTIPNPREPALYYANDPAHRIVGPAARIVAALRPAWCYTHEGRPLLRLPPSRIAAMEIAGLATPAPWVLNRGGAAAIALDSGAMRAAYLALGFPAHQLAVVGDTNGGILARGLAERSQLRRTLLAELGLVDDRPLVVCAFPPDQYGTNATDFEHADFPALVDAWMEALATVAGHANVVVRPHPRLAVERLAASAPPRVVITERPTIELVPLADLYVASISATIRWAIACGVPVIDYDCYRYRYGDYSTAKAVIHVEDRSAFRSAMHRFFSDPVWAAELATEQRRVSGHWGIVDDGCEDRVAALVADLVARRPQRRAGAIARERGQGESTADAAGPKAIGGTT